MLATLTSAEITEWLAYFNLKIEGEPQDPKKELTRMFGVRVKKKGK